MSCCACGERGHGAEHHFDGALRAVYGVMTTGKALFLLDAVGMLLVWPVLLHFGCWGPECFRPTPDGAGTLLYPLANLISFYALGLYRREAILQTRESLGRVPLAVSLGALGVAVLLVLASVWIGSATNRVRLFSGAVIGFSLSGVTARLILAALKRRGVFQRHLLVVGAGTRAWDMLCMLRNEGRHPQYRITFVHEPAYGSIDTRLAAAAGEGIEIWEGVDPLTAARRCSPDEIVVAPR